MLPWIKEGVGKDTFLKPDMLPDKGTKNLQEALKTGADHNIVRRTENVSPFPDIGSQSLSEIRLSLWLSIGKHSFILAQGAFHIAAPQVKTKALFIYARGSKVVLIMFFLRFAGDICDMVMRGNFCYIIATLGLGNDIAVCRKLKVGCLNGGSRKLYSWEHFLREGILLPGTIFPSRISFL